MNKHFWNKVYDYLANYRYYKLNNNKYQIQQMLKNDNELETFVDEYNKKYVTESRFGYIRPFDRKKIDYLEVLK